MSIELWMRKTHESGDFSKAAGGSVSALQTHQWRVARAGVLQVQDGPLWLTRDGDPDDHVLQPGDHLHLRAGERVTVGAWRPAQATAWQWRPDPVESVGQRFGRALVFLAAGALDRLARGLEGWAALARTAAASASRAHGCISAGDSMASSGALK
ncbi:hypothetical protein Lcho_0113 [Leptothrix cholodnii SP-6]|uniref:DUF2917 domain-containing protein n=1 Tax=Leptothrix cholodnii (strain ATCC 51168 / LMG 8142 / SP-6) TaxID=395495 RepID=B1Y641_LEPCP|nr:hypothetical protein Lcho_0113 [Leptothrix cholodnii SP-6]